MRRQNEFHPSIVVLLLATTLLLMAYPTRPYMMVRAASCTTTTTAAFLPLHNLVKLRGGGGGGHHSSFLPSVLPSTTPTHIHKPRSHLKDLRRGAVLPTSTTRSTTTLLRAGGAATAEVEAAYLSYNATSADPASLSIEKLCHILQTNLTQGLTTDQVHARQVQYGPNILTKPSKPSIWSLIAEQFEDRLVQILVFVALVSGIFSYLEYSGNDGSLLHAFVEPLIISAILILNAAVGVWQSHSASDSLDALQQLQPTLCNVLRRTTTTTTTTTKQEAGEEVPTAATVVVLPASELVPGDILQLRVGDKVPADARVVQLQSSTLQVEETSLTGESVTVSKLAGAEGISAPQSPLQDQKGMVFSGTMITSGNALALVVQTGMDTQFGKIQAGVSEAALEQTKTPLAMKLDEFGNQLTFIIGGICALVFVASIPKMQHASFANPWQGALYYAKVAVALGVAAIPEGLPAVITLCLSLGTRRMAQRNVIVRKLPSVETLGCTSVICTDKTGTLTTNEMTVVSVCVLEEAKHTNAKSFVEHSVEGTSYSPLGKIDGIPYQREVQDKPQGAIANIAAVAALCNDATIVGRDSTNGEGEEEEEDWSDDEDVVDATGTTVSHVHHHHHSTRSKKKSKSKKRGKSIEKVYERTGEPTEAALCVLAEKLGGKSHVLDATQHVSPKTGQYHLHVPPSVLASAHTDAWRQAYPRRATLEFNRDRKSMSVLCRDDGSNTNKLLVKGAPNLLIDRCTHIQDRNGKVVKLTGALRREVQQKVTELATRPLRCLALAIKDANTLESSLAKMGPDVDPTKNPLLKDPSKYKDIESGLTLVGIVGIKDPARPEVADSMLLCQKAGIRVILITGDARDTAVAIAKDVNIFDVNADPSTLKAFEGREFFLKSEEEQLEILKKDNIVFCRAEPADKQKLVKMLQRLGEIPAMTGDGVNDAPALQQAAIGIAMGTGTEVSKEAADMILADDNFATIVSAVEEGRTIYANMQAFICFLISCNIGEICAIFLATICGFPEPLSAMHLLWVNLVTDGPPATALGFNPPSPDMMEQPPRPSDEPIMTKWLLTRYCITGLYVGLATIGVFCQHYVSQGISLTELANWSQCGTFWTPSSGMSCTTLFQESGRMLPQTLALTTLVCMEMLKALSAVSVDNSLLTVGPQSNKWLLLGVAGPCLLHLGVVYSEYLGMGGVGDAFGLVPLSWDDWKTVAMWALPILLVDEVLKAVGRRVHQDKNKVMDVAAQQTY